MRTVFNRRGFATIAAALVGAALVGLSVAVFERYGWSLFLGVPVVVSFLTAFFYSYGREVPFFSAYRFACLSLFILGALILLFALDGLICLIMALPLALLLALPGVWIGRLVGQAQNRGPSVPLVVLVAALLPGLVAFDSHYAAQAPIRSVTTSVFVDAPPARVWETVIAFPKITEPPRDLFRWGIAYPIEARIEGSGIGAVRYCTFSTGDFVEPITAWEPPRLLAFDVAKNPPPMEELSLYEKVSAPHLHGHMVSHRGEFRLHEENGRCRLQGTTWYSHSLSPEWYWGPISDQIIHRIHRRVLEHIARTVELR